MKISRVSQNHEPEGFCDILEKLGFEKIYEGSHVRFKHSDGRRTVIPVHGNEALGKGLISEILRQIKMSKEEYDLLRQEV
ncbi:MAG: type II toxin-antitoxin system HicA family toxin [Nanoarchaeota archaeon]|nr:type II toxin-antitoxin system HicA family toxin [Nanoarchaeota archaeon]